MDVIFIDNINMLYNFNGGILEYVVFIVGKGLGRGNDDRVISVCIKRVEVFYVIVDDGVVCGVLDNFVFDFFLIF